ncbi:MAG: hypothetical protein P4M11_11835 [Candidatus Pacebacteria bacterium]|nr:hypothetical protein [Candidatus Paceibacterota bacterium]
MLEREPKRLADVNSLVQTMLLPKFKFITNVFLNKKRERKRVKVLAQINETITTGFARSTLFDTKYKYLMKLPLCTAKVKDRMGLSTEEGECYVHDGRAIQCDPRWPVCFFDHSYKSRCVTCFRFRSAEPCPFIEDYFDPQTGQGQHTTLGKARLMHRGGNRRAVLVRNLAAAEEEDKANSPRRGGEEPVYDSLLIERNIHCCQNETFAESIRMFLEQKGDYSNKIPPHLIHLLYADELDSEGKLDEFVSFMASGARSCIELPTKKRRPPWEELVPEKSPEEEEKIMRNMRRARRSGVIELPQTVDEFEPEDHILLQMVSNLPHENSDEIVANSPIGKLLRREHRRSVNVEKRASFSLGIKK